MIPFGDPRKSPQPSDTQRDREARRRSAAVSSSFTAAPSGLDFNKRAPAAPSSGMNGSFLDLYGSTAFKADIVKREERDARVDRLPAGVQRRAAEQGVTDLTMLEATACVVRACKAMGGNPAQVFSSDVGRALGITTAQAEEALREASRRGFIEPRLNSYWRSHC